MTVLVFLCVKACGDGETRLIIKTSSSLPLRLFLDEKRVLDPVVRGHLELDAPSTPELKVQCLPYESVHGELQAVCSALGPKEKVWISDKASCALTQAIPKVRQRQNTLSYTVQCKCTPRLSHIWLSKNNVWGNESEMSLCPRILKRLK